MPERPITEEDLIEMAGYTGSLYAKVAAEIRELRSALESIREQTKCRSVKGLAVGKASGCWFKDYGRHAPDCNWEISEQAEAALAGQRS